MRKRRDSLEFRAHIAGGRERFCGKCPHNQHKSLCPFVLDCHAAFVRGYIKGAKMEKNRNK